MLSSTICFWVARIPSWLWREVVNILGILLWLYTIKNFKDGYPGVEIRKTVFEGLDLRAQGMKLQGQCLDLGLQTPGLR